MKNFILPIMVMCLVSACNHTHKHGEGGHEHDISEEHGHDSHDKNEHSHVENAPEATFVHTVFFWMKEGLSEQEAKFFEDGMEKLGKTPSILSYKWGKPAGTQREVVDNTYTYAWIAEFASSADQDAYQVDPVHVEFIEESKDLWTKVQVYDTVLDY